MKKTHVTEEISKIMKRARGRYGVALGQLVQINKIEMPLISLKAIPLPFFCNEKNVLPLEYTEAVTLLEPITRLGRSVADIVGLKDKISYIHPRRKEKEIPVGTEDYGWLSHNEECETFNYRIHIDDNDVVYKQAICFVTAIRCVSDVQYISTRRGDMYICCHINKKRREAVHMGRVDARAIEPYDPEQEMWMAAKYFQEELLKTADTLYPGRDNRID